MGLTDILLDPKPLIECGPVRAAARPLRVPGYQQPGSRLLQAARDASNAEYAQAAVQQGFEPRARAYYPDGIVVDTASPHLATLRNVGRLVNSKCPNTEG